ncbi:hypothetical protein CEXT_516731 [Caerostris extrusa]|uniref:Uncharacterized protein n=1 Tax=Caerostris extrusa TaxID=172846 RepID=A0AAV4V0Q8_CAEEX|nr:hypothetical protein CEXT_516731 [Caerostris extrusa]
MIDVLLQKHRPRSESPHYIPLSETYSCDKAARMKKSEASNKILSKIIRQGIFEFPPYRNHKTAFLFLDPSKTETNARKIIS